MKGIGGIGVVLIVFLLLGVVGAITFIPGVSGSILSLMGDDVRCDNAPYNPWCVCPEDMIKDMAATPIPYMVSEYRCLFSDQVIEYKWIVGTLNTGGAYCQQVTLDVVHVLNPDMVFDSNAECLASLTSQHGTTGCPLEVIIDSAGNIRLIYKPHGSEVYCNEDRHPHQCYAGGWVVDFSRDTYTSGNSYCPALAP
jgi:hypothetical protein